MTLPFRTYLEKVMALYSVLYLYSSQCQTPPSGFGKVQVSQLSQLQQSPMPFLYTLSPELGHVCGVMDGKDTSEGFRFR